MAYIICEPCVGVKDKACVEICPVDCIYEGDKEGFPDMLFIHPDECIDCGVCQPECPVNAIFPKTTSPRSGPSTSRSTPTTSSRCKELLRASRRRRTQPASHCSGTRAAPPGGRAPLGCPAILCLLER